MNTKKWSAMAALALCLCAVQQHALAGLAEGIAAYRQGNFDTALKELTPEAESGNAEAQIYLGRMYELGKGAAMDAAAAFKWYLTAANQGNLTAEEILGMSYLTGMGVDKDVPAALKWLQASASGGRASAQYQLASMFGRGEGVPKNSVIALKWLRMSADQHYVPALVDLGLTYQNGLDVKADKVITYALYNLSVIYGPWPTDKSILNRGDLAKSMAKIDVKNGMNLFCALKNSKSLISTLDAYVANHKNVPANACAANSAK